MIDYIMAIISVGWKMNYGILPLCKLIFYRAKQNYSFALYSFNQCVLYTFFKKQDTLQYPQKQGLLFLRRKKEEKKN